MFCLHEQGRGDEGDPVGGKAESVYSQVFSQPRLADPEVGC